MTSERDQSRLKRIDASFFSKYWRWELSELETRGQSVEDELAARLPHLSASSWAARFELGGVYLAGRIAKLGEKIVAPSRLEYYEPRMSIESVATFYPRFISEFVLYQDEDLAVVFKPERLPTTPARDQQRYNLQSFLETHLSMKVHLPSRLDSGVSGVLLCSLSPRMNRYLQKAYERHWIEKYYIAEVMGRPSWSKRTCEKSIDRDPLHPVLRRCVSEGGETALTKLELLSYYDLGGEVRSLLLAQPLTGRTHQIRVHCADEGFPIVGDPYYGDAMSPELRLISSAVKLFHPFKQEQRIFRLPKELMPEWLQPKNGS
jgi:23S rRNA pseudouridine1911/1915/1917 synthase